MVNFYGSNMDLFDVGNKGTAKASASRGSSTTRNEAFAGMKVGPGTAKRSIGRNGLTALRTSTSPGRRAHTSNPFRVDWARGSVDADESWASFETTPMANTSEARAAKQVSPPSSATGLSAIGGIAGRRRKSITTSNSSVTTASTASSFADPVPPQPVPKKSAASEGSGGTAVWIKVSVLKKYLNGVGAVGGVATGMMGFKLRSSRNLADELGRKSSHGGDNEGSSDERSGRSAWEWDWVRGVAEMPKAKRSPPALAPSRMDTAARLRPGAASTSRSISLQTSSDGGGGSSPKPLTQLRSDLPLQVTVRDALNDRYNGKTVTLSVEDARDGVVTANLWWQRNTTSSAGLSEASIYGGSLAAAPPSDLIELTHLHEPAVVHCLRTRYATDQVYTSTGPILLALNPFRSCDGLYSEQNMSRYWEAGEGRGGAGAPEETADLPPHVYAVVDRAYREMMRRWEEIASPRGVKIDKGDGAQTRTQTADQSILVSGESGAGKTVTTKIAMQYLATLSQRTSGGGDSSGNDDQTMNFAVVQACRQKTTSSGGISPPPPEPVPCATTTARGGIERQVLQSNPILESFGNARTVRNDNSSRFGKFIEMQFRRDGSLIGASIETYLLEKVRLISPGAEERNYHIFYELLEGASKIERREWRLVGKNGNKTASDFCMTASASDTYDRRDGVNDGDTYRDLRLAMTTVGFTPDEQRDILAASCAMLHASNVTFIEAEASSGADADASRLDRSNLSLDAALTLLGVSADALNDALCTVEIDACGEKVKKHLSISQAAKALEAFIKATYGALFTHIVARVNESITVGGGGSSSPRRRRGSLGRRGSIGDSSDVIRSAKMDFGGLSKGEHTSSSSSFISVLDIFGFESFEINSFEQLCINYCNEALQQQFNRFVFKLEQQEYEREGIEWSFVTFPDNQDVLDLIEKKHVGILSVLDEQCRLARCTDRTFANAVYEKCRDSDRLVVTKRQMVYCRFGIHHYAGTVEYDTTSFLAKNKDDLPKETTDLLLSSNKPLIATLGVRLRATSMSGAATAAAAAASKRRGGASQNGSSKRGSSTLTRASVGGQFTTQLRQLRERIDRTSPHYIRCLKPNDDLVPDKFVPAIIADQLRCAGVLEAVRVSRVGFPQRYSHDQFLKRFRPLAIKEVEKASALTAPDIVSSFDIKDVCHVLLAVVVPQIREVVQFDDISEVAAASTPSEGQELALNLLAVGIQMGRTKVFLRRKAFDALEQLRGVRLEEAAIRVQSILRCWLAGRQFHKAQYSIVIIQTISRGGIARRLTRQLRAVKCAVSVQAAWRRFTAKKRYLAILVVAQWCQRIQRGRIGRTTFLLIKVMRKALIIQTAWRRHWCARRYRRTRQIAHNMQLLARSMEARKALKELKAKARDLSAIASERDALRREAQRMREELEEARRKLAMEEQILQRRASEADVIRRKQEEAEATKLRQEVELLRNELNRSGSTPVVTKKSEEETVRLALLKQECQRKDKELDLLRREVEALRQVKEPGPTDGGVETNVSAISTILADTSPSALQKGGGSGVASPSTNGVDSRVITPLAMDSGPDSTSSLKPFFQSGYAIEPRRQLQVPAMDPGSLSSRSALERLFGIPPSATRDEESIQESRPGHLHDEKSKASSIASRLSRLARQTMSVLDGQTNDEMDETVADTEDDTIPEPLDTMTSVAGTEQDVDDIDDESEQEGDDETNSFTGTEMMEASEGNIETAFHAAVREGDEELLIEALENAKDVETEINSGDHEGRTPLHIAALSNNIPAARFLLGHDAVANSQDNNGNSPLHYAESYGVVSVLLEEGGANPNIPNRDGVCALHLAVRRRDVESVSCLIFHDADVNVADDVNWFTPLHLVSQSDRYDSSMSFISEGVDDMATIHMAKMLCAVTSPAPPDVNYQDRDGNTPLHHAAILQDRDAYDLLSEFLRVGGNVNIRNHRGQTPLHLLCHNQELRENPCYQDVLKLLLAYDADPNVPSLTQCTALHLALYHRDVTTAVRLLHHGAQLHLPWQKPAKWDSFWATDSSMVFCMDMIEDEYTLHRVLEAVSCHQRVAPPQPNCMHCRTQFGPFARQRHCRHCGRLVCGPCSPNKLWTRFFPDFCEGVHDHDQLRVCVTCEEILISAANEYDPDMAIAATTGRNGAKNIVNVRKHSEATSDLSGSGMASRGGSRGSRALSYDGPL